MQQPRILSAPAWPRSATTRARPHGKPRFSFQAQNDEERKSLNSKTHFSLPAESSPRKSVVRELEPVALPLSSIRKQLLFDNTEIVEGLEESLSPILPSMKRLRSCENIAVGTKRYRDSHKRLIMSLEMYDPVTLQPSHFRCYYEGQALDESRLLEVMIESNMDDDCQTDDEQVEAAKEQLGKRLVRAINSFKP